MGYFGFNQIPGAAVSGSVIGASGLFGDVIGRNPITSLLLHMDGPNGQITTVDSSLWNNPVVMQANAMLSTAHFEFGTASFFRINTDNTRTAVVSQIHQGGPLDILSGSGDFTIEGWINFPTAVSHATIFDYGGDQANAFGQSGLNLTGGSGIGGIRVTGGSEVAWQAITFNGFVIDQVTFYHFACQRVGGFGQLFFNGQASPPTSLPWTGYVFPAFANYIGFGWSSGFSNADTCYIDEMRVSRVGRYKAVGGVYAVPTAPFVPD